MDTVMVHRSWVYGKCDVNEGRSESVGFGWNGVFEGGINLEMQEGGTHAW